MQYFQSTKDFRDTLFQLTSSHLGTMTFPSGAAAPAIYVGIPPVGSRFEGLEINLAKFPSGNQTWLTGGTAPNRKFEFTLIQHPSDTQPTYLNEVAEMLAIALTPCSYRFIPSAQDPSGQAITLDQVVFSLDRSALLVR